MKRGLWVGVIVTLLSVSPAIAQTSVLDRTLSIDALGNPVVWLPGSIGDGTFASRIAMSGQLPLIFEPSPLPTTSPAGAQRLDLTGKTVREALDLFVAADARYTWTEVNGVIVIRPLAAMTDAADSLNAAVTNVVWDTISAAQALAGIVGLISGQSPPPPPTDFSVDESRVFHHRPGGLCSRRIDRVRTFARGADLVRAGSKWPQSDGAVLQGWDVQRTQSDCRCPGHAVSSLGSR